MEVQAIPVPEVVLNSGHTMPLIGFGSVGISRPTSEELIQIYLEAIRAGYRHFDTAEAYHLEEQLGQAVVQALELGLIKDRDELFITSKVWCNNADYDHVLPALRLMRLKPESDHMFTKEDILPFDIQKTWEAMEKCSKLGLAKSVGVSNFTCHKLSILLQHATISPAVNQVEMNPAWQQHKMLAFCKEKGINVCAWSPLGANGAFWGSPAVMQSTILKEIADSRGKRLAQIALGWIYEQGACVIVKSFNNERMRQNLDIFDWELNEDDLALIAKIPQRRGFPGEWFVGPDGPYKTFDELWDGEFEA